MTPKTKRSLLARVVAGFFVVAMYCVNTVAITGFALTSTSTKAEARGRGRGRGGG